jgi:hypothetical protein
MRVIMNDLDTGAEARAREQRAREREARALAHERAARQKAATEADPEHARALRDEAGIHARAASVHHATADLQAKHARDDGA